MERRNKVGDVDDFLKEAIDNIRHDRALTKGLLTDILTYIKKSTENHKFLDNFLLKSRITQILNTKKSVCKSVSNSHI